MTVRYLLDRYYSSLALNKVAGLLSPWVVVQEYPSTKVSRVCFCLDWGFSLVNRLSKVLVLAGAQAQWWPIDQAGDVLWELDKLIPPMSPGWAPPSTQTRRRVRESVTCVVMCLIRNEGTPTRMFVQGTETCFDRIIPVRLGKQECWWVYLYV